MGATHAARKAASVKRSGTANTDTWSGQAVDRAARRR